MAADCVEVNGLIFSFDFGSGLEAVGAILDIKPGAIMSSEIPCKHIDSTAEGRSPGIPSQEATQLTVHWDNSDATHQKLRLAAVSRTKGNYTIGYTTNIVETGYGW